jgi:hypothetical protein
MTALGGHGLTGEQPGLLPSADDLLTRRYPRGRPGLFRSVEAAGSPLAVGDHFGEGTPILTGRSGTQRARRLLRPELVSLGICAVRAAVRPDLRSGLSASDRERPPLTGVNGPLMAWRLGRVVRVGAPAGPSEG